MAVRTHEIYGQDVAPGLLLFPFSNFKVHCPAFIMLQLHQKKEEKKRDFWTYFYSILCFQQFLWQYICGFNVLMWSSSFSQIPAFYLLVFIAFTFITSIEKRHQHTHREKGIASPSLSLIFWASAGLPSSAVTVAEVKCTIRKAQEWELQNAKKKHSWKRSLLNFLQIL